MDGEQLYGAVLTSVPFLLLALVAETQVFGPAPNDRSRWQRRGAAALDTVMLVAMFVAFAASLWALTVGDPPDLRLPAAYGLGLAALAAWVHAAGRVWSLYRKPEEESAPDS